MVWVRILKWQDSFTRWGWSLVRSQDVLFPVLSIDQNPGKLEHFMHDLRFQNNLLLQQASQTPRRWKCHRRVHPNVDGAGEHQAETGEGDWQWPLGIWLGGRMTPVSQELMLRVIRDLRGWVAHPSPSPPQHLRLKRRDWGPHQTGDERTELASVQSLNIAS